MKKEGYSHKIFRIAWLLGLLLMVVLLTTTGCQETGNSTALLSEEVVELADNTAIPDNGIINAAQFRSIAGIDREVTFSGVSDSGITYFWTFNGKDIKNPVDQNLKVDFVTTGDTLEGVKTQAGNAPYGIGMSIKGSQGLITIPTLTIILPTKWDADAAILCKINAGSVAKMGNAIFDTQSETTRLTVNVIETGDDYYIVGGKTTVTAGSAKNEMSGAANSEASVTNNGITESSGAINTCIISINCATLLNHMKALPSGKAEFVPADGWILYPTEVTFTEGESVHDVLQRVCQNNGIHMESSFTPAYNSAYIEGINQIYEFDGGELSGWMYNVNGWFPNYGCSQYNVKKGDTINLLYTCDLGKDVGDNSMW